MEMESGKKRPAATTTSLLGSLRTAVKKVRFLLSFSATRWILSSIAGNRAAACAATSPPPRRIMSFSARRPSLLDVEDDAGSLASPPGAGPSRTASLGSSSTTTSVSRTSSGASSSSSSSSKLSRSASSIGASSSPPAPAGYEDIDRRADQFIANFYRHIQMERQVSLQLRYCRGNSLQERTPPR